jgi:hypothetical protein
LVFLTVLFALGPWITRPGSYYPFSAQELLGRLPAIIAASCVLLLGASLVIRNSTAGRRRSTNAVTALQAAYLANDVLCLGLFADQLNVGAYLALVTAAVYVAEIIRSSVSFRDP